MRSSRRRAGTGGSITRRGQGGSAGCTSYAWRGAAALCRSRPHCPASPGRSLQRAAFATGTTWSLGRRRLQRREPSVLRIDRFHRAQEAHGGHGGDARRRRVLAGGERRGIFSYGDAESTVSAGSLPLTSRSWAWRPRRTAAGTGCGERSGIFTYGDACSSVRPGLSISMCRSWAWRRRTTVAGDGWWRATVASLDAVAPPRLASAPSIEQAGGRYGRYVGRRRVLAVASDGGIFTMGTRPSMVQPVIALKKPVVGMAPAPQRVRLFARGDRWGHLQLRRR